LAKRPGLKVLSNCGLEIEDRHGVRRFFRFTRLSIGTVLVHDGLAEGAEDIANLAAKAKYEATVLEVGLLVLDYPKNV
jgi:hypothetical protein